MLNPLTARVNDPKPGEYNFTLPGSDPEFSESDLNSRLSPVSKPCTPSNKKDHPEDGLFLLISLRFTAI